jgi:hypothetical protein
MSIKNIASDSNYFKGGASMGGLVEVVDQVQQAQHHKYFQASRKKTKSNTVAGKLNAQTPIR